MVREEKSIIEEAALQVEQILEAAENKVKNDLAKSMPEKFDKLLKEELNKKNNKESVKESKKDTKNEPITEGKKKADKNNEPINEVENIDMRNMSITDIEEAYDEANPNDQIQVEPDELINLEDIEEELQELESMANDVDSVIQEKEAVDTSDPYQNLMRIYGQMSEMVKEMENNKMKTELGEQFNAQMTEMYGDSYESVLGETLDTLRETFIAHKKGEPFGKAAPVNEEEAIAEAPVTEEEVVAEEEVSEMHQGNLGTETINKLHKGDIGTKTIEEEVVDEAGGHGVALSHNKHVGSNQVLKPEYAPYKKPKLRSALQKEWSKKMGGLLTENKRITKAFNEAKTSNKKKSELIKEFNNNLGKYREQLQEMAVFNTNLAYSNNLLLDEGLTLTAEDKKKIVTEFKKVGSITESEEKYKYLVVQFKGINSTKNVLTEEERVADKVNNSIEPSASKTITEQVNEQTAFGGKHMAKIMKNMMYEYKK